MYSSLDIAADALDERLFECVLHIWIGLQALSGTLSTEVIDLNV